MTGQTSFDFTLNGRRVSVENVPPHVTLLQFLRSRGLTGTKEGCAEGDCGACTVALVDLDAQGRRTFRAIDSCITLLPMVAGREIVTVEGVAEGEALHSVQDALVRHQGSQCGYCTPGFVLSMIEGYYRPDLQGPARIADQLAGNLCRCTGYRPIRDAMSEVLGTRTPSKKDQLGAMLAAGDLLAPALDYRVGGEAFLRPTTLAELLEVRVRHPEARLVAGATEVGVEINKKGARFPFLVSTEGVRELAQIREDATAFRIGGGATLTCVEEAIRGKCAPLEKMLQVFASRQVRSRATLAGNLVTASPIGDTAPVLLAFDAEVVLESRKGRRSLPLSEFFVGYRKTALASDEILREVVIPKHKGPRRLEDSFKASKRRELDISTVSAAFAIELDEGNVVRHARLAYGGVAATPARARFTEAFLVGKPWTEATIDAAAPILLGEFQPLTDVRGSAEYRRQLVVSLFRKFFRGDRSAAFDAPPAFAPGERWGEASDGRELKHESARAHVTGSALYVHDVAQRRGMLEVWPVRSPFAHAKILSRDTAEAQKVPGVVAVLTASDIPGLNSVGAIRHDEALLAGDEALYHGHMVALVVGETLEACREAAAKVKVEYQELPAIVTIKQALEAGSFLTEPHVIRRGDCEAALEGAPHRIAGELEIGGQEHFYLETQTAWAERGDEGDVFVCSSTQNPTEIQKVVAEVLDLPRNRVTVQSPRMGGAFGGKESQGNTCAAIVALASWATGRPVRMQMDRDVDFQIMGKRHPFFARFEAGFDDAGHLLASKVRIYSNGGWAADLSESIFDRAMFHLDNSYFIPNVDFEGRVAKTNVCSMTAFRGFGGPQGVLVVEEILDRVARTLGLAPEVVRDRNLYGAEGEKNTTHFGQKLGDGRLRTIWDSLVEKADLPARRKAIAEWNRTHSGARRGLAMTPVKFGISFTNSLLNQAGALVLVYRDGTVQVNHGGTEMGQGLYVKIQGVVMRELGLPASRIRVMRTQTDKVPNTSPTAASTGADLNGAAVKNAVETLKARLVDVAAKHFAEASGRSFAPESIRFAGGKVFPESAPELGIPFEKLADIGWMRGASLSATGYYKTPNIAYDKKAGRGTPFYYFAYGAAVAEVEVDAYTGAKRVLRVDVLHDVGDSLNPNIDRGQIEGAFLQGMGWMTSEELLWDDKGRLLTHSASTYAVPAFGDAPPDIRVHLLPNAAQPGVIHGSKAVGEPPLLHGIAVREAIRDAIAAFGGAGPVDLPMPATNEAVFFAVQRRLESKAPARKSA